MADIFQEIEEDLRRDRFMSLWRRYGTAITVVAVLALAGVAGYIGWQKWRDGARSDNAEALAAAMAQAGRGESAAAAEAFDTLAERASGSYAALARLDGAAAKRAAGDVAGAVADYDAVAATAGDDTLATMARLLAAQAAFDAAAPDDLARRLDALPKDGAWQPFADELRAFAALKAGRTDEARQLFESLQDNSAAPAPVRDRAGQALIALGGPPPAPSSQPSTNEQQQP